MIEYVIEIAVNDYNTAKAAVDGGADRIELCADLAEGGITPSFGMINICREIFNIPIFPIIRPRGGDFLYNEEEFEIMQKDIMLCKKMECDGVVFGMLKSDGTIDIKRNQKLLDLAYPMEATFHRAFDRCVDPFEALEQLIEMGFHRILTSGQCQNAIDGINLIEQLIKQANTRIIIMPGSGIRKENIYEIAKRTNAFEFHSSLRTTVKSDMQFIHPSFHSTNDSYYNVAIDPQEVKNLREALSQF